MHSLELMIADCEWLGKNFAHNLDFVPDDKLDWKPSPTAKSALEITGEVLGAFSYTKSCLEFPDQEAAGDFTIPLTRDEAKGKVIAASKDYAEFMRTFSEEDLNGDLVTPLGPFSKVRTLLMPVRDLNHHHGQLAYLQTIWGDNNPHFFEFGT